MVIDLAAMEAELLRLAARLLGATDEEAQAEYPSLAAAFLLLMNFWC